MFEDYRNRKLGYSEIRRHVAKTGHTVHLEVGVHTDYSLGNHAVEQLRATGRYATRRVKNYLYKACAANAKPVGRRNCELIND